MEGEIERERRDDKFVEVHCTRVLKVFLKYFFDVSYDLV